MGGTCISVPLVLSGPTSRVSTCAFAQSPCFASSLELRLHSIYLFSQTYSPVPDNGTTLFPTTRAENHRHSAATSPATRTSTTPPPRNNESCQVLSVLLQPCIHIFLSIPIMVALLLSLSPGLLKYPPNSSPLLQALVSLNHPSRPCQMDLTQARAATTSPAQCLALSQCSSSVVLKLLATPSLAQTSNRPTLTRTLQHFRKATG